MKENPFPGARAEHKNPYPSRDVLEGFSGEGDTLEEIYAASDISDEVRAKILAYLLAKAKILKYLRRKCGLLNELPKELMLKLAEKKGIAGVLSEEKSKNAKK